MSMADLQEVFKKWILDIQNLNLEDVISSLKSAKCNIKDAKSNKYLFKLIVLLSRCADRCHKEHLSKELEIYDAAYIACQNLTEISDKSNFFSGLYFIISYLLSNKRFKEAKDITEYLLPGKIISADDPYEDKKYYQLQSLWYTQIFNRLDLMTKNSDFQKEVTAGKFCSYVDFHLKILRQCSETSYYFLKIAEIYFKNLLSTPLTVALPIIFRVIKNVLAYIANSHAPEEESFRCMIYMIGLAFLKRNDAINNVNILTYFRQCDVDILESLRNNSSQCSKLCYKFLRDYTINLYETNLMSNEIGTVRFDKVSEILKILKKEYGSNNYSVVETVRTIGFSFETLFSNWENSVLKQSSNSKITSEDILKVGYFVKDVHSISKLREFPQNYYFCKKCPESKCLMKNDIHSVCIATSAYVRVISKMTVTSLTEEIFKLTKDLIKELLLAFYELKNNKCKYADNLWDLCGKTIFNFGILSESKYPAELEDLYETLCSEIVCHDGLNSKLSSFGLENPVSTALQRLTNSNFNQGKYRKAMTYTAYSALLSTSESRKKKAFDSWALIKSKSIDLKEIQELTLIECLSNDTEVIKKLGINVKLENYNLNDICLRELKSLYSLKTNMITSFRKILSKIESIGDGLSYAQGVLMLCFNALQLVDREFIADHISKAIDKLKSHKPRSASHQCLLANLIFFSILEKFYARKKAINKQMDDANFTIKAFKALQTDYDGLENENKEEIVPTYGGISIEEDGRCAKEFRDLLMMWDCLQKHVTTFIDSWEPKFTLETIILCGEYCRLYKFDKIEEKTWKLAYILSSALQDPLSCLYVTSRSISLRCINETWIENAERYVESIESTMKPAETEIVALYWLSLADFYLDCKKVEEAKSKLNSYKELTRYTELQNPKINIYETDIRFRNYTVLVPEASQEEYCQFLVKIHYLMINLNEILTQDACRFCNVKLHLFACEQLFETMCNVIIPMMNLLSIREISAHMIYGLKLAQSLGMTLRIAQFLKYFCYFDLLRQKIDNCETNMQDLEYILKLENFKLSMKAKIQEEPKLQTSSTPVVVRDCSAVVPQALSNKSSSPELKRKIFSVPDFMEHTAYCQCFKCSNVHYQYLTFSCSSIRAQMYSLLNYTVEAEQHFHGAQTIWSRVEQITKASRRCNGYKWKAQQKFTVDYILHLLDFTVFIYNFKVGLKEEVPALIEKIYSICSENDLYQHPVCVYASEIYFEYYMCEVLRDKLSIAVPTDIPIDITDQHVEGCITPRQQVENVKQNRRRRKSPKALAVPVLTIDSSDEAETCDVSPIPVSVPVSVTVNPVTEKQPAKKITRNVRRKILLDEVEENTAPILGKSAPSRKSSRIAKKSAESSSS